MVKTITLKTNRFDSSDSWPELEQSAKYCPKRVINPIICCTSMQTMIGSQFESKNPNKVIKIVGTLIND